jgi:hypothetical protein
MRATKAQKEKAATKAKIAGSDFRIKKAIDILSASDRGQETIKQLKPFLSGAASGLDSIGGKALLMLVEEFVKNHRRGFLP